MREVLTAVGLMLGAYLWGSVPWGFIVARVRKGVDVREYGSGAIGTTNVIRTVGIVPGLMVLLLDLGKGAGSVAVARALGGQPYLEMGCALATLAGHNWSLFLRFHGGRGIAAGYGALIVMSPWASLVAVTLAVPTIFFSRFVSLGSLVGAISGGLAALALSLARAQPLAYGLYGVVGLTIILLQHRPNIQRLLKGKEHRLGQPAQRLRDGVAKGEKG